MNVCDAIRAFPLVDHSGSATRIVLEQNKLSKKSPLTGIEPGTLGLFFSSFSVTVSCLPN